MNTQQDFVRPAPPLGLTLGILTPFTRQWGPRVRHVLQDTEQRILICGCTVRKNFTHQQQRVLHAARKRLVWWETGHGTKAHIPQDVGIVIQMQWKGPDLTHHLLNEVKRATQVLRLKMAITPILSPNEVFTVLSNGLSDDAQLEKRLESLSLNASEDGLPFEAVAAGNAVLAPFVGRKERLPEPTHTMPLRPGQLRAWMIANEADPNAPRAKETRRLWGIAQDPTTGIATTEQSIEQSLRKMEMALRAASPGVPVTVAPDDAPDDAPAPAPPAPAAAPEPSPTPTPPPPPVEEPPAPPPPASEVVLAGGPMAGILAGLDAIGKAVEQTRAACLGAQANIGAMIQQEVSRTIDDRTLAIVEAAMEAAKGGKR